MNQLTIHGKIYEVLIRLLQAPKMVGTVQFLTCLKQEKSNIHPVVPALWYKTYAISGGLQ